MLIKRAVLDGIVRGDIDLQFRRWRKPTVKAGGKLRTAVGELAVGRVDTVTQQQITAGDASRAGYASRAALLRDLASFRDDGRLYRIEVKLAGPDPRVALRHRASLSDEEVAELRNRLARYDGASTHGPWTMQTLELIERCPATLAADIAASIGREKLPFKADVRKLKELGLTESLEVGYRLSPRGRAFLERARGVTPGRTGDWGVCVVDTALDSRAVTFENPTGERGAGGAAADGRKGAPSRRVRAGERVVLADLEGPGLVRHVWMTFPPAPPPDMRAVWMEVFYDDATAPSVSVPCLDFFGVPHGRPISYASALTTMPEGRGLNAFFPMPFRGRIRVEVTNGSSRAIELYYQIDYTRQRELPADVGFLHCAFRRENPTTMGRDFVIADVPAGPGRFLGCVVGVRVLDDGTWYGEGEVKVFRDGDRDQPTICGTGLEDYVGSAWGMGVHHGPYAGAPLIVDRLGTDSVPLSLPAFVGFYRWHVVDPIVFTDDLRVTIQQIGMHSFPAGAAEQFERFAAGHPAAGGGWRRGLPMFEAIGLHERVDDYCAAAFFYCTTPQPVERLDVARATADLDRLAHERPDPMESFFR